jgi:uncharacterized membrane protein YtjA (UPF0391 family)
MQRIELAGTLAVGLRWHDACDARYAAPRGASLVAGQTNLSSIRYITCKEKTMLHYAVVFFVIALIAALFGFGGIAAGAAGIAKILFFAFLLIAIVTFVMSLARK